MLFPLVIKRNLLTQKFPHGANSPNGIPTCSTTKKGSFSIKKKTMGKDFKIFTFLLWCNLSKERAHNHMGNPMTSTLN